MEIHEKFKIKEALKIFWKLHSFIINITPHRLFAAILISGILGVLPSISVYITQSIINMVQRRNTSLESLIILCLVYVFIEIVYVILNCFQTYNAFIINQKVDMGLTELVLNKTKDMELIDFESPKNYDLISRAKDQTSGKAYSFYMQILGILQSVILILSNIVIVLHLKEYIMLIPLIILIFFHSWIMLSISEKRYKIIKARTNDARKEWYYQYLLTNDIAFKEIKLFGSHSYFLSKFKEIFLKFFEQDKRIQKETSYTDAGISLMEQIVIGGAFIISMEKVYNRRILIGDALAYVKGINNIKSGIQSLCTQINSVLTQAYYIKLLFDFIEFKKSYCNKIGDYKIKEIKKIEFKNVSFRYLNKKQDALKNINITLIKGKTYIVIGKNGSGKSTFLKLLSGYYMNYSGEIFINDIDFRELNLETYREKVSVLLQDFVKYEMTIDENVRIASLKQDITDGKIKQLMTALKLPDFISNNINQQLGYWFDGGTQISGGQWLKIALARILLRNADLRVFDEPNAALDQESSYNILKIIMKNSKDKINVISLHHFKKEDLEGKIIYMFKNGEIIEKNH